MAPIYNNSKTHEMSSLLRPTRIYLKYAKKERIKVFVIDLETKTVHRTMMVSSECV